MEPIEQRSSNGHRPALTVGEPFGHAAEPAALRRDVPAWLRGHLKVLVLIDVLAAISATLLSQLLAFGLEHAELEVHGIQIPYPTAIVGVVPAWLTLLAMAGSYDIAPFGTPAGEVRRVVNAGVQFLALMAVAYYLIHLEQLGRDFMIAIAPLATGLTLAGRAGARVSLRIRRTRGQAVRRAVVMGPRDNTSSLLDHLALHPSAGIEPVAALIPDDVAALPANGSEIPVAGTPADALDVLLNSDADLLLVTGRLGPGELRQLTWTLEGTGVDVLVAPTVTQLGSLLDVRPVAGLPLLYVDHTAVATEHR